MLLINPSSSSFLIHHPDVLEHRDTIRALMRRYRKQKRHFSDLYQEMPDGELQYVDVVMEGGGVLGLALVGYIHALESAGIRFLSVGGTSAGSIMATLLMACDEREHAKTKKLLSVIGGMEMESFIDGGPESRDLCIHIARGKHAKNLPLLLWHLLWVIGPIRRRLGLNPGRTFEGWLSGELRKFGAATLGELRPRIARVPKGLRNRATGRPAGKIECDLGIIAADITTETKVTFPKMAGMYWPEPERVSPASFVRASMSIPLFFEPYRVKGMRRQIDAGSGWKGVGNVAERPPEEVVFADGGTMSNFPIGMFHGKGVPEAPTFGIKLGAKGRRVQETETIFDYGMNLFDAMRHYADYEFISDNPDYKNLIGYIDTSKHNWLNFYMDEREKRQLFLEGMVAGYEFLRKFDWEEYKRLRREMKKQRIVLEAIAK